MVPGKDSFHSCVVVVAVVMSRAFASNQTSGDQLVPTSSFSHRPTFARSCLGAFDSNATVRVDKVQKTTNKIRGLRSKLLRCCSRNKLRYGAKPHQLSTRHSSFHAAFGLETASTHECSDALHHKKNCHHKNRTKYTNTSAVIMIAAHCMMSQFIHSKT